MAVQVTAVRRFLLEGISSRRFAEGEYLPPVELLAESARCSPDAVRRALRQLSDQGVVERRQKKGTRVVRRPASGRALLMRAADAHTNLLLQDPVEHALMEAGLEVESTPYLLRAGASFDQRRQLAAKEASRTVLVALAQEDIAADLRPAWEEFAAPFRHRLCFQFEDLHRLSDSVTVLPDPVAEARLVAEHLVALGHRRIGVVAGGLPNDGTREERRAAALAELAAMAGVDCCPYHYGLNSEEGVVRFIHRNGCTAWWTITDYQALDHILLLQRGGLRVPEDVSVVGTNDTPWATGGALPLTTLSLNPAGIAEVLAKAARAVFAPAEKDARPVMPERRYVRPILMPRASTAPAKK